MQMMGHMSSAIDLGMHMRPRPEATKGCSSPPAPLQPRSAVRNSSWLKKPMRLAPAFHAKTRTCGEQCRAVM